MSFQNLRHLRVFLALASSGSVTQAAAQCHVSQPAVSQSMSRLSQSVGAPLFARNPRVHELTVEGTLFARRVERALQLIDSGLAQINMRAPQNVTAAQLTALIAVCDAQNIALAARRIGLAQPTVQRAIGHLERAAGRRLFQRSNQGVTPVAAARELARRAGLARAELLQAQTDLADHAGREVGEIVIGALPLAHASLLPQALTAFRAVRPRVGVTVIDGAFDDLTAALRRGEIDLLLGALRDPATFDDVVQEVLFYDELVILARAGHPLAQSAKLQPADLREATWIVPRQGSPSRRLFDLTFGSVVRPPVETGSLLLMREMLIRGDCLACVSAGQAAAEIDNGLLMPLQVQIDWPARAIGLTTRRHWLPTRAQAQMIDLLRTTALDLNDRGRA